jgi:predicted membrane protein
MVVGLTIMLLGLTLLGDQLRIVQAWTVLQYWPVMVTLFGAAVILRAMSSPSTVPENPADKLMIAPPLVLLIVIVAIVAAARSQERPAGVVRTEGTEYVTMNAIMAGNRHTARPGPFRGAQVSSVMGGINLDLRQATIEPGTEAVVDVFALMGGVDLFVPRDWNVETRTTPIMGDVQDHRFRSPRSARNRDSDSDDDRRSAVSKPATAEAQAESPDGGTTGAADQQATAQESKPDPTRPRLIVRGFIMMGGLQIRP